MRNWKKLLPLLILTLLLLTVFLTVRLSRQRQEVRKQASTPTGVVTTNLSPTERNIGLGENFDSQIIINTKNKSIKGGRFVLNYTFTGASPPIEVQNIALSPDFNNGSWSLVQEVTTSGNRVTLTIFTFITDPLLAQEGYSSLNQNVALINITFAGTSPGTINLAFNPDETAVWENLPAPTGQPGEVVDILQTPTGIATYTIGAPTITLTPSPGPSPTISPTPTLTPTLTPIPTPTSPPTVSSTPTAAPTSPPVSECACSRVALYDTSDEPVTPEQIQAGQSVKIFVIGSGTDQYSARAKINNGSWINTNQFTPGIGYYINYTFPASGGYFAIEGQIECPGRWVGSPDCQMEFELPPFCPQADQGDLNCDTKINEIDLTIFLKNRPASPTLETILNSWQT